MVLKVADEKKARKKCLKKSPSLFDCYIFANGGKISANLKHEQSKIVKYNHLLANFTILYNVNAMTEVFNQLKAEGYNITRAHMAAFSPYHTEHLGRLGSFEADLTKKVKPMTFELLVE